MLGAGTHSRILNCRGEPLIVKKSVEFRIGSKIGKKCGDVRYSGASTENAGPIVRDIQ